MRHLVVNSCSSLNFSSLYSIKSETEEPTSSPFCQIPQNSNITTLNDLDANNDEANVNSSETVQNTAIEKEKSPSVIIDRSLADRVSKLMKQGIQVQFNHQGVETIKDRSKSPEEGKFDQIFSKLGWSNDKFAECYLKI